MSAECETLHRLANAGTRLCFPFVDRSLPANGIYVLFEAGESAHSGSRIVRVGSHRGDGQLAGRLTEHFVNENKYRSIFRKNIGRALLWQRNDPFLLEWDRDRTSRAAQHKYGPAVTSHKRLAVESEVTAVLRNRFSFMVF